MVTQPKAKQGRAETLREKVKKHFIQSHERSTQSKIQGKLNGYNKLTEPNNNTSVSGSASW